MATLIDLTKELDEIFHELSPKERMRAMRNTMVWAARQVRREAVSNLSQPYTLADGNPGNRAEVLRKAVREKVFRKKVGFFVTVQGSAKSKNANHENRWGKRKPAARWFETGTAPKGKRHLSAPQEPRPFLGPAWERTRASVETMIRMKFEEQINKIARKHNGN